MKEEHLVALFFGLFYGLSMAFVYWMFDMDPRMSEIMLLAIVANLHADIVVLKQR